MDIIIKGAEEIKLDPLYIQNLKLIPRASVPPYLEMLAKKNYLFIGFLFRQKFRTLVQGLSKISWAVYYPGHNGIPSSAFFTKKDTNTNTNSLNTIKNLNLNNDIEGCDNRIKEEDEIVANMKITKKNSLKTETVLQSIAAIRKLVSNICLSLVILPGMLLFLWITFHSFDITLSVIILQGISYILGVYLIYYDERECMLIVAVFIYILFKFNFYKILQNYE